MSVLSKNIEYSLILSKNFMATFSFSQCKRNGSITQSEITINCLWTIQHKYEFKNQDFVKHWKFRTVFYTKGKRDTVVFK